MKHSIGHNVPPAPPHCAGADGSGAAGRIRFDEPPRAEGQRSVLRLAAAPIPVVRIGFVGLGVRGIVAVGRFARIEGVRIAALCDTVPERIAAAQELLARQGLPAAAEYGGPEGWRALCARPDLDLVYICTPWRQHVPIAVHAMEQGRHAALEVPAATSLAECWQLVDTAERTQRHCMMLENAVYDLFELTTLHMVQQGLLGDILYAEGAYIHDLEAVMEPWRIDFNRTHRGDVYATHGLGPLCQLLDIHRGDRMDYLVSMDTGPVNGLRMARERVGAADYANGDHTLTFIRTAKGRMIQLQHNVCTPRPYTRIYQVTGTDGFACKYPVEGFFVRPERLAEAGIAVEGALDGRAFAPDAVRRELMARYAPPIAAGILDRARQVDERGGLNYIMDYRLVYCLRHGLPLDMDVYDAAEWSCLGELTAASLEHGSMPVAVPDFTRGDWMKIRGYRHAAAE